MTSPDRSIDVRKDPQVKSHPQSEVSPKAFQVALRRQYGASRDECGAAPRRFDSVPTNKKHTVSA
jgi:hypothetical protein